MRPTWLISILAMALILAAGSEAQEAPANLDFEQGRIGEPPPGFFSGGALRLGYRVATTDERPHGGQKCVRIQRDSVSQGRDFGSFVKVIDATPYRGRRVRLSGWLRFEALPALPYLGSAQMWLRVDRRGGRTGLFDNLDDRPVRSPEWTAVRIQGEVAEDADSIAFGAFLSQSGRAWVDDLALELLGPAGEGHQPARALSSDGAQNLVAFARLLGYVRHFHPSDQAATTDWESFAIAGVDEVESAATPLELAAILERIFHPVAPTVRIATRRLPKLEPASLRPPRTSPTRVIGWWHHGWGGSPAGRAYHEHRVVAPIEAPGDSILPVGSEVSVAIGRGLWCSVPLTVYADSSGTLPHSPGPGSAANGPLVPLRPEGWIPSGRDRATRLAGVMLFWNVAQHFYPYFDVVGTDWPARLPAALRAAAEDRDHEAYAATLERLVSALHDGHGRVSGPTSGGWSVPLAWRFAENRLVVDAVDTLRSGRVRPGDEVIAIDGRPIAACIRDAEARVSGATPQYVRARVAARLATIEGADSVALDLRSRAGATWRQRMVRDSSRWVRAARRDSVAELRPGLLYIDLRRVTDQDFQRELPRLAEARGVIFDLRGYPGRISPVVLAHLIDTTITSARWNIPIVRHPDHRDLEFEFSNWPVSPRRPRIRARAAFLIDARAISYAETYLGMVEHYRLAELVGEATAGTNGNIVMQRLPGGYFVVFTGMKVLKHDGSRHHGVGILPTVPVSPTIAGIAAGRDEQLEKAIEVVSR